MTREKFDKLSTDKQLDWIIENKKDVILTLDNDSTMVQWTAAENEDDGYLGSLNEYIGQSDALIMLLKKFGIASEFC